jgi:secreted trypsin-like serine protease
LIGAVAVAAGLGVAAAPASAIIGGAPDEGEHPYVGQLFFYVPSAVDPRFDEPGGWFNCTGTLIDATTVVTAGHCTYDVGVEGVAPADAWEGGTDVWFSVSEAPNYSVLPPSSTFVPDRNEDRYDAWSAILDASAEWAEAESTFTHPDYVDAQFLLHDLGVVKLSEPIVLDEYGALPTEDHLDQYQTTKQQARFESVGYGLEDSGPKVSLGGDTRRKADRRLVSFQGAYGYRDISVMFSHANNGSTTGGTCFGDSGGPTFDITTPALDEGNVIVAVTSFGMNANCNASGSYRIDQPEDLEFIQDLAG